MQLLNSWNRRMGAEFLGLSWDAVHVEGDRVSAGHQALVWTVIGRETGDGALNQAQA